MVACVILGHPHQGSFNHAIAETVVRTLQNIGYNVVFHDLYAERFDPVLPYKEISRDAELDSVTQQHCDAIAQTDGIVVIHPNWWGQPPAMLKGWIDRVFRPGVAYEFVEGDSGGGIPHGLLKARTALVFNTSNTAPERETEVFGDPLETLWRNCIFGLCGVHEFYRKTFSVVVTSTTAQRLEWLKEVERTVRRCFSVG